uniref:Uncharacterized protein n=1 Tax=Neisseria meningitidis alpha153 TaxID=663926 RepID=C6SBK4_NEIME|nr:hypothetical protein predicted by Glimmer/Critica [Neisseria meningitidis alpha153]
MFGLVFSVCPYLILQYQLCRLKTYHHDIFRRHNKKRKY